MADTNKTENAEGKDQPKESVAPEASKSEKTTVNVSNTSPNDEPQYDEEVEFTDTISGTVVKARSLLDAVDKINAQNKDTKDNK